MRTFAKDLRAGDVLEPDGTRVVRTAPEKNRIAVTIKPPGQRSHEVYVVDPYWPLERRSSER